MYACPYTLLPASDRHRHIGYRRDPHSRALCPAPSFNPTIAATAPDTEARIDLNMTPGVVAAIAY